MVTKSEDFANAGKNGIETAAKLANVAFDSVERLAALNLEATRSLLETSVNNANALFAAKDAKTLFDLQTTLAQPVIEKTVAYSKNVYEIASQTKEKLAKVFESQLDDVNAKFTGLVVKALNNAPAGSGVAVATVKSAIAAANSAYDGLNKAAKTVADIADANIAAATAAVTAPKASKAA